MKSSCIQSSVLPAAFLLVGVSLPHDVHGPKHHARTQPEPGAP